MKVCTKCKIEKDESDYYICSKSKKPRSACKLCYNAQARKHYEENTDYYKTRNQVHYLEHKEEYRERGKEWAKNNKDKIHEYTSRYWKKNPDKMCEFASRRRARKRNQTPDLTKDEINRMRDLYWLARDLRAVSGQEYHVDHIIPLARGGLHHPDNLQILPADLNVRKAAK